MTNARPNEVRTGAVVNVPGGHGQATATDRRAAGMVDPEVALVGALLHCTAPSVLRMLDHLADDDLADHRHQQIARAIRELATEGRTPDPVAVHARLRADGTAAGVGGAQEYMEALVDAYHGVPTPASAPWYAAAVLDEALRRRCIELAARVAQAADGGSLDVLVDVLDRECRAVRAIMRRRDAAAGEPPARPWAVGA